MNENRLCNLRQTLAEVRGTLRDTLGRIMNDLDTPTGYDASKIHGRLIGTADVAGFIVGLENKIKENEDVQEPIKVA